MVGDTGITGNLTQSRANLFPVKFRDQSGNVRKSTEAVIIGGLAEQQMGEKVSGEMFVFLQLHRLHDKRNVNSKSKQDG